MSKLRIGIIFGGFSREREISFAGGRTVYDNLNKDLFEAVPVFVDSFGNFILLEWQYIYKGSIRDFYPPVQALPADLGEFQIYAESLGELDSKQQEQLTKDLGRRIPVEELKDHMDFAFLCLHGPFGEDGKVQGLLESLRIPYSGSGILPSAIGINKSVQKKLMKQAGFPSPAFTSIKRDQWLSGDRDTLVKSLEKNIGFPMVIKSANQGSSIGITIVSKPENIPAAVDKAFFVRTITSDEWRKTDRKAKEETLRSWCDIREGFGLPVRHERKILYRPLDVLHYLDERLQDAASVRLEALDAEVEVVVEGFIRGKEFSCIVIQDLEGKAVALPPTEIRKGTELFDYRSKYLPGLSRKITPIHLPDADIENIRSACEKLFIDLAFDVYARIDGFLGEDGKVYLNDPNTTSGMMPSSFFFHQAAEIGLNPSQFLTYIIYTSLAQRRQQIALDGIAGDLLHKLDERMKQNRAAAGAKIRVAVILGGFSSERHISVESGRNIYEKLSSSSRYAPVPVFLSGDVNKHLMYKIPVNILLKDNADDIYEKILNYSIHPVVEKIIFQCSAITERFSDPGSLAKPALVTYEDIKKDFEAVFIALHGRPGEDGAVQEHLDKLSIPYNGSGVASSRITIDKFMTNEVLKKNGFLIAEHALVTEEQWTKDKEAVLKMLADKLKYPFIAKPVDDGCSSAVKRIKTAEEFSAFARLMFRKSEELDVPAASVLKIKPKEEFPKKNVILVEELISRRDAKHFLEITGGMLTKMEQDGTVSYEVFEASEALAGGDVLSLEEKFLAGQGQNITPARYAKDPKERQIISDKVKETLGKAAKVLGVVGYCRIDAFVRIYDINRVEVIFIEVNSLPGMTPATCIFHQSAINGYRPYDFIDRILNFGFSRVKRAQQPAN